ncbi:3-isopropylmalate dehydratase small subunit [Sphingomonas sp. 28-63-12]|uniref:3-isopropylmalate dehydratase small subunit n=1 Tax=Sphingomonas sp. 28-63-12 TaxID=1970434 RepID=UPI000BD7565A|nr:MAG: 3-isopropylmalate dehydratase small subunit [Sphingomonas sp. 28-63-12]
MTPFVRLAGYAAVLAEDNIDTDIIFPARFLLITTREVLGTHAFHDRRFDSGGAEVTGFMLNQEPWRGAVILIAGANFGCGSSREQAVWALADRGLRCIIAPSFGEIFQTNCFRNGLLPIVMPGAVIAELIEHANRAESFVVDLENQILCVGDGPPIAFSTGAEQRLALLNGWDETALIMNDYQDSIADFELVQQRCQPWLYE